MARPDDPLGLLAFARTYLEANRIVHHSQIRTEELADLFRAFFRLPAFARLADLYGLCERLGVALARLPAATPDLLAVNTWHKAGVPTIHLRPDLDTMRAEHSIGHELREVLEISFKMVNPRYDGLDTSDNKLMNPESDQFASCLLMPSRESKDLFRQLGYDALAFAKETGRPLPSVIVRMQHLFSAKSVEGPVAGLWLFEAPWGTVEAGLTTARELVVRYTARLRGFSLAKSGSQHAQLARRVFPSARASAADFEIVAQAVAEGCPVLATADGFDLWEEHNFEVIAEPLFVRGTAWRVLLAAIRRDSLHFTGPWIERIVDHSQKVAVSWDGMRIWSNA